MNSIDLVENLAEMRRQYADAHRPVRSIEQYRERHARRHPERNYDSERHVAQYLLRRRVAGTSKAWTRFRGEPHNSSRAA